MAGTLSMLQIDKGTMCATTLCKIHANDQKRSFFHIDRFGAMLEQEDEDRATTKKVPTFSNATKNKTIECCSSGKY